MGKTQELPYIVTVKTRPKSLIAQLWSLCSSDYKEDEETEDIMFYEKGSNELLGSTRKEAAQSAEKLAYQSLSEENLSRSRQLLYILYELTDNEQNEVKLWHDSVQDLICVRNAQSRGEVDRALRLILQIPLTTNPYINNYIENCTRELEEQVRKADYKAQEIRNEVRKQVQINNYSRAKEAIRVARQTAKIEKDVTFLRRLLLMDMEIDSLERQQSARKQITTHFPRLNESEIDEKIVEISRRGFFFKPYGQVSCEKCSLATG